MTAQLPFSQTTPLETPALLRTLQADGTVHRIRTRTGDTAWLVTGYDQVRALLDDDRLGRSHRDPGRAARSGESALFGGPLGDFHTEKADHARMRSLLQPHFSPGRMRAFRPRVEALTAGLLDDLAKQSRPAGLHTALAVPLPVLVICELLGVPYEDRDRFRAWTRDAADVTDRARSEQGVGELFSYGLELAARRRRSPGDDVISRLCEAEGVGDDEVAMLAMALLFAGHETTVVQIGLAVLLLLTHPDAWQRLREDPSLIDAAVEEILRAPGKGSGGIPRYARTDLTVDGTDIAAGDLLMLDTGAANHDPHAFPGPDTFDIARRAGHHLTFGHGARYCLGAPLARIELRVVLTQLVDRFPGLRLAVPPEQLTVRSEVLAGGLTELPVTW